MTKIFNNTTERVVDDLKAVVKAGDKMVVASACFSIYAFHALKDQLKGIDELRFLFTSPTFAVPEKAKKESREYFIPQRGRERSLHGTDFEIRFRPKVTRLRMIDFIGWDCAPPEMSQKRGSYSLISP